MTQHTQHTSTHVIIGGIVFPYADKRPYVESGYSILGALEYNKHVDVIKCHVCGEWVRSIGHHIKRDAVTVREYRAMAGLNSTTALCVPGISQAIKHGANAKNNGKHWLGKHHTHTPLPRGTKLPVRRINAELRNLRSLCYAQIQSRVIRLALDIGHTPTKRILTAAGLRPRTIKLTYGISLSAFYEQLGLTPNPRAAEGSRPNKRMPLPVGFRQKHEVAA